MLTKIGTGEIIYSLRKKIQSIKFELNQLDNPPPEIPELIESTNLLRLNEYLSKTNDKKTDLLCAYEQYSAALEGLLETVFDIQNELKDVLKDIMKEQLSTIDSQSKKSSKDQKTKNIKK
ncbi:MAG: hypothetical protein OEY17_06560 [Nitrosopumilus sp.]|nr:hypothetical protein [Nitrosopumilus sp.]MDH5658985.1 hypothetical protein [Nitrosopumilus sp.]